MNDGLTPELNQQILEAAQALKEKVIGWRRHFHMHPELSNQEFKTAQFIVERLKEFGVDDIIEGLGGSTSVVALIKGAQPGPTVALRADMDALPLNEKTAKPYCSTTAGAMHACGHDAHTAMLLGAVQLLVKLKAQLKGQVKFIFQACEERLDGGASVLIKAGVLKKPDVGAIFGLHVFPELKVGTLGTKKGMFLASSDMFHVTVEGEGGHASRPHLGTDSILIAAKAISALHHIVSRRVNPVFPAVLTIGMVHGGQAENVIPSDVSLGGTVRALDLDTRKKMPIWIEETLQGITTAYGGKYKLDYQFGSPPLINDPDTTQFVFDSLQNLIPQEQIVDIEYPSMGGEDFGEYLLDVPGTFVRLGVSNPAKGIDAPLHSPYFDIDEDCLPLGVATLTYLAVRWLQNN